MMEKLLHAQIYYTLQFFNLNYSAARDNKSSFGTYLCRKNVTNIHHVQI